MAQFSSNTTRNTSNTMRNTSNTITNTSNTMTNTSNTMTNTTSVQSLFHIYADPETPDGKEIETLKNEIKAIREQSVPFIDIIISNAVSLENGNFLVQVCNTFYLFSDESGNWEHIELVNYREMIHEFDLFDSDVKLGLYPNGFYALKMKFNKVMQLALFELNQITLKIRYKQHYVLSLFIASSWDTSSFPFETKLQYFYGVHYVNNQFHFLSQNKHIIFENGQVVSMKKANFLRYVYASGYSPLGKSMTIFGGSLNNQPLDTICECIINNNRNGARNDTINDINTVNPVWNGARNDTRNDTMNDTKNDINLGKNPQWNQLECKLPIRLKRLIVHSTIIGDYLIVFGGTDYIRVNKQIFIYDVIHKKCYPSIIEIPCFVLYGYHSVLVSNSYKDELIVFGFIRSIFAQKEYEQVGVFPDYLMKFVHKWIRNEYFHIMARTKDSNLGLHQKINIDHILRPSGQSLKASGSSSKKRKLELLDTKNGIDALCQPNSNKKQKISK